MLPADGSPAVFDPLNPKMSAMDVDDVVLAKTCHLVVTSVLGPMVSKGAPFESSLSSFVGELQQALPSTSNQILATAFADIRCACAALEALVKVDIPDAAQKLDEVLAARKGPLFVLRQEKAEKIQEAIDNIPNFRSALRAGAAAPLESVLCNYCTELCSASDTVEDVERDLATCQTVANVLSDDLSKQQRGVSLSISRSFKSAWKLWRTLLRPL